MNVEIVGEKLSLVIHQIAKRKKISHAEVVAYFLRAGLSAERERILRERSERTPADHASTQDDGEIIIENPCSEQALRKVCGDDWEVCWWLASCSVWE